MVETAYIFCQDKGITDFDGNFHIWIESLYMRFAELPAAYADTKVILEVISHFDSKSKCRGKNPLVPQFLGGVSHLAHRIVSRSKIQNLSAFKMRASPRESRHRHKDHIIFIREKFREFRANSLSRSES